MPSRRLPPVRILLLAVLAALVLAACGEDEPSGESGATAAGTATPAPAESATATADPSPPDPADLTTKPVIDPPTGAAPTQLQRIDVVRGTGRAARTGDTVEMQYVGWSWSTGLEFDSSWDRGAPFSVTLGQGDVIGGWDQGIVGMRVGGRRRLVIPPALGYGETGSPPTIAANETLVFIVDLISLR